MMTYGGGDLKNFPIEVQEHRFPLRIHEYRLRPNSGGDGQWRGGLGLIRKYEVLKDSRLSTWFERTKTTGRGLLGAGNGKPAEVLVEEPNGKKWNALKCADVAITAGTKITVKTGGGGGFGLPEKRLKKSIKEDKKQGYIN